MSNSPIPLMFGTLFSGAVLGLICGVNLCKEEEPKNDIEKRVQNETKIVHEYYDTDSNGLYDCSACFFERGTNRWLYGTSTFGTNEFSKAEVGKAYRVGEVRFVENWAR